MASTVGVLAGLLGVEHGLFETLQGNVATSGPVIDAIGHQANSVFQGSEPALTFIPNFFVTGVLAIIVSIIVIIWATAFVWRKNGGLVLILLSIIQLFVGGGLAFRSLLVEACTNLPCSRSWSCSNQDTCAVNVAPLSADRWSWMVAPWSPVPLSAR